MAFRSPSFLAAPTAATPSQTFILRRSRSRRVGFPPVEPTARHVIMVVQVGRQSHGQVVGLLVDAVSDILTVTDGVVQPTPDVASEMAKMFVRGVLAVEGRMISLIALDAVLPAPDSEAA
jgi:purine-binding chemotaxis protein CheW